MSEHRDSKDRLSVAYCLRVVGLSVVACATALGFAKSADSAVNYFQKWVIESVTEPDYVNFSDTGVIGVAPQDGAADGPGF